MTRGCQWRDLCVRDTGPNYTAQSGSDLAGGHFGESVGTLFAAAMVPGLILAGMLGLYLVLLGIFKPEMVPAIPKDERDAMSTQQLLLKIGKVVVPPLALVFAVLGSIVGGCRPDRSGIHGRAWGIASCAVYRTPEFRCDARCAA